MQKLLQIFVRGLMIFNSLKIVELCKKFLQYLVMTFNSSNFQFIVQIVLQYLVRGFMIFNS